MHVDDVGVPQPGDLAGLGQHFLDLLIGERSARLRHLDGDVAVQLQVVGTPDLSVSAAADQRLKRVPLGQGARLVRGNCRGLPHPFRVFQ